MVLHQPYREFMRLSTDQLIESFDQMVDPAIPSQFAFGPEQVLNELTRREAASQTRWIVRLTVAIAVMTLANVGLVAWSILPLAQWLGMSAH